MIGCVASTACARTDLGPYSERRDSCGLECGEPAPCQPVSQTLTVAADLDDGEFAIALIPGPHWFPSGEWMDSDRSYFGWWAGEPIWAYFRFRLSEAIAPAGLNTAGLHLYGTHINGFIGNWAGAEVLVEDAADAGQVDSEDHRPGGSDPVTLLNASIDWSDSQTGFSWNNAGWNTAPDLSALINGLASARGGLAAGSHVQLWIRGKPHPIDVEVAFEDFARAESNHTWLQLDGCQ